MTTGLYILGFGGHGRSVADVALAQGYRELGFYDEAARPGEEFLGFPVRAHVIDLPEGWNWIAASGDNQRRAEQLASARYPRSRLAIVRSPHSHVATGSAIAPGTFIGHFVHVGPRSSIGEGCILNNGAIVEHDCVVGAFTHVSVHATVAGATSIGERVFVGAGATVRDGIQVTNDVVIGAGSTVIHSIDAPGVYVGSPVHRLPG